MLKNFITFLFICSVTLLTGQESYYSNVDLNLTGQALKNELATKISVTHTNLLFYTPGVWEASKITDANTANTSEVVLIYGWEDGSDGDITNDRTRDNTLQDTGSGATFVWNREHVFPKSLANPTLVTNIPGPGTDAHHLRPADRSRNTDRWNLPFALGNGTSGRVNSNTAWYPGDEWKGDVARMIMYMYVRYGNQCLPSTVGIGSSTSTGDEMIDLFLTWNAEDPVSDIERTRNTYHEDTNNTNAQGNRNPFIDNPYLATLIWGGDAAEDTWGIYTSLSVKDNEFADFNMYPNPTHGSTLYFTIQNKASVTIYTVLGKSVLTKEVSPSNNKVDISNLATGMYLVKIATEHQFITKKLIKRN